MNDDGMEHLTEELLDHLLNSGNVETYLDEENVTDRRLVDYLRQLLDDSGVKRSVVARRSGIHPTVVYDIFSGKTRPGRDNAIKLAFGLGCGLRETQRLLRLAGASELWCKQRRDAIIIWCLTHGFDRAATDDELYRLGEPTLVSAD
ncbi:helix-turn-helix transcriptional regulator [Bifidobacterium sp. 82T24]|uniref:helix-turn-helix domain-containing protein n=1 Tax=Bifidobacterium pluvialisilvae TaxID=2834436 RepID=UPI001C55A8AE|nr:helix-turn-helix transcriptional regulator [Bifidobacterium pluvialisilvae]MBW3088433.1 helix-turn-helix transcriptional regulator [Bifidobacterium pluvialisilvae]